MLPSEYWISGNEFFLDLVKGVPQFLPGFGEWQREEGHVNEDQLEGGEHGDDIPITAFCHFLAFSTCLVGDIWIVHILGLGDVIDVGDELGTHV